MINSVNSVNSGHSGSDNRNSTLNGGTMNPFKIPNSLMKAFMLVILALVAFASDAAAQSSNNGCRGKTVYLQLPEGWGTSVYMLWEGQRTSLTTRREGDWTVVTLPSSIPNDGPNKAEIIFTNMNSDYNANGISYITSTAIGNSANPPSTNKFTCSQFGDNGTYIMPDPTNPSRTRLSTEPPDAYYFYFYPPNEDKWKVGTPYLLLYNSSNGEITAKRLQVVADKCGWYRYIFFNEPLPDGNPQFAFVSLGPNMGMDLIGNLGVDDPWEDLMPEPINLKAHFDRLVTNPLVREVFYVPSNGSAGWTRDDPGVSTPDRCYYEMAAIIYDTDQSIYNNKNDKADLNGPFKCGIYQTCGEGSGISRGIVNNTLNNERKMTYRGAGNSPALAGVTFQGANDGWSASTLTEAFTSTPGKNVQRCYNMPFARNKQGLWEFDSDRLCMNGQMDPEGTCAGNTYGGLMGGFFPRELQATGAANGNGTGHVDSDGTPGDYSQCAACRNTQQAETWVPLEATVNKWCFDRGWLGTGNTEGNLEGATAANINDRMRTACGGSAARPFQPGDFRNGDTPSRLGATNQSVWDWGRRPGFGRTPSQSASSTETTAQRNLFFCFESHSEFTYEKGQEFFFRGDDDIWIFINNHLVIDLGGSHLASPGYVLLDTITTPERLEDGKKYPIDIFFCDSRSTMSNVRITTNMYFSQSSGWDVEGDPMREHAEICLSVTTSASTCGGASGGTNKYCGTQIGDKLEYYLVRVGPNTQTNLNTGNAQCNQSGTQLTCYGGLSVDLAQAWVQVERDKFTQLGAGTYKVMTRIKSQYANEFPAEPKQLAQFSITGGISVVWGDIWKDDGDGTASRQIRDLGPQHKSTVAGRKVPVGFASAIQDGNRFYVEMDPYDGSPGKTFRLDQSGLEDAGVSLSGLKVYRDSSDTEEVNPSTVFKIPDNGLLVLWVTGDDVASDDANYKVNINGVRTEGSNIKVVLPIIKFINHENIANPTVLPARSWQTKGSDISRAGQNVAAADMIAYIGSPQARAVAAYENSSGAEVFCADCNFNLRTSAWAVNRNTGNPAADANGRDLPMNNDLILIPSPFELKNGIAEFSFAGLVEISPELGNYGFFTVGGPSRAERTLAQWDSLTFEKPVVPIPVLAEIFDRDGNGIGDEVRIAYDKKLTGCRECPNNLDSLPNYIEIFWDLNYRNENNRLDTIGFGPSGITKTSKNEAPGYEYTKGNATNVSLRDYWTQEQEGRSIVNDSIIVIKCDNCFSNNIKTSVGPERSKVLVQSWASFKDEKKVGAPWTAIPGVAYIQDRIPAIVVDARYEPDETANCAATTNPGCSRDRVRLILSEPVVAPEGGATDAAVKAAFAYKLRTLRSEDSEASKPFEERIFKVYQDNRDLATRQTWSPSSATNMAPTSGRDSIVDFIYTRYRVIGGDTTNTPQATDSVKFASTAHGVTFAALVDLAGNEANPAEIGVPIQGFNPSDKDPIHIAVVDPTRDILEEALDYLGFDTGNIFKPGDPIEILPVPDNWGQYVTDSIKTNYPGSVGMVFSQDINSRVQELEEKHGVKIPASAIEFHVRTFFHTNLGNFVVNRDLPVVKCDDQIFGLNFAGPAYDCRRNNNGIYVAWNLKDAKNRWVGAGAYVGIYDFYWRVNCKDGACGGKNFSETFDKIEREIQMHGVKRARGK
jgi:fibro-slime domain-containing protein